MRTRIIDWDRLKHDLLITNPDLTVFDFLLLENIALRYWDRATYICENKEIFYQRYKNILYIELMRYLQMIKANNYLNENLKLAVSGEVISNSITNATANTQTETNTDPLNPDGSGVYYQSTFSEADNKGDTSATASTIDNSKSLDALSKIANFLFVNKAYDNIIIKLQPMYRIIDFKGSRCCSRDDCCNLNYYTKGEVDALIDTIAFDIETEVVNESTDPIAPIIELEVVPE